MHDSPEFAPSEYDPPRHDTPAAMFRAHFFDMVNQFSGDGNMMVNYALTLLVSILHSIRQGDEEQVIEDLRQIFLMTQHGIDEGSVTTETLQ